MIATIEINRMRLYCYHGVMAQETRVGNEFEVTAHLNYPLTPTDDISETLNYAEVAEVIRTVMSKPTKLLETLVVELKEALTRRFPLIEGGYLCIAKLAPPIRGFEAESVAVGFKF